MVLAAEALAEKSETAALTIDGAAHSGAYYRTWKASALEGKAATITNAGQSPTRIVVTVAGNPFTPEPAAQHGYQVERTYYTLAGKKIDASAAIKQNDRFIVALTVTETEAAYARLLLNDPLPAGLEIDNPDLFEGGSIEELSRNRSSRTLPNIATIVSPPPLIAMAKTRRPSRWPMSSVPSRPAIMSCRRQRSKTCIGRNASAAAPMVLST
jgi:uncharacterized protein YfaS (alpha-2-macroglobulin family)